jgi:8-oxo-dGTP diphosphatase
VTPAGGTPRGAAVFILDGDGRVLLIKEDYGAHRWGLPGGLAEPSDGDLGTTAIREAREETRLDVQLGDIVGTYTIVNGTGDELIAATVFRARIRGGELRANPGEIADTGWFDPNALPEPLTTTAPVAIPDGVAGTTNVGRTIVES